MAQELLKEKRFFVLKLAFELVVIFLGVYLAFLMDDYRESKAKEERRTQISKALYEEIDYFVKGAEKNVPLMASALKTWQDQYESGKKPEPLYFDIIGIDLPTNSMWEATVASGGLNVLEIKTLKALSTFYNGLHLQLEKLKEIQRYAVNKIAPHLENPGYFYHATSNKLKPEYRWHMKRMKYLNKNSEFLLKLGKEAWLLLKENCPELALEEKKLGAGR